MRLLLRGLGKVVDQSQLVYSSKEFLDYIVNDIIFFDPSTNFG